MGSNRGHSVKSFRYISDVEDGGGIPICPNHRVVDTESMRSKLQHWSKINMPVKYAGWEWEGNLGHWLREVNTGGWLVLKYQCLKLGYNNFVNHSDLIFKK